MARCAQVSIWSLMLQYHYSQHAIHHSLNNCRDPISPSSKPPQSKARSKNQKSSGASKEHNCAPHPARSGRATLRFTRGVALVAIVVIRRICFCLYRAILVSIWWDAGRSISRLKWPWSTRLIDVVGNASWRPGWWSRHRFNGFNQGPEPLCGILAKVFGLHVDLWFHIKLFHQRDITQFCKPHLMCPSLTICVLTKHCDWNLIAVVKSNI